MNLTRKLAVVIVALGSVSVAQADPIIDSNLGLTDADVTYDFDDNLLGRWEPVTDQFSGVTFSDAYYLCCTAGEPPSLGVFGGFLAGLNGVGLGPILFDEVMSAAAFSWRTAEGGQTIFESFLDGVFVESFTADTNSGTATGHYYGFEGILFDEMRVTILPDGPFPGPVFSLDNLQWTCAEACAIAPPVPVPEPSTLALLGLGLLGMAAARRRRKA